MLEYGRKNTVRELYLDASLVIASDELELGDTNALLEDAGIDLTRLRPGKFKCMVPAPNFVDRDAHEIRESHGDGSSDRILW